MKGEFNAQMRFKELKEREFEKFLPNYLSVLIPRRLLVGEFPSQRNDIRYLKEKVGVTHIVNIKPETAQTTPSGENKASWYALHMRKLEFEAQLVRIPLEDDYDASKLLEVGKQVAELLKSEKDACIFIHRSTGMCEEALIALLAWHLYDPQTYPKDLQAWMKEKELERLLSKMEEGEALLKECISKSKVNTLGNYFQPLAKKIKK